MENFRPVSNLSFISKLTERVVLKRLTDHIMRNNIHEQFLSAYKPNHSTETALMRVHNDILMSLDNKRGVVLIMLDLSAAFDTVVHSLLLGRMRSAGVIGIAHQYFASYLTSRTQSLCLDRTKSQPSAELLEYKLLLLTSNALHHLAPSYLTYLLQLYQPTRTLRSSSDSLLTARSAHLRNYGDRAFCVAAPKLWNNFHSLRVNADL